MENLIDIVMHPIRMRIIMGLVGREMTAQQMAEALGDVPPATLYRHLNRLAEAGILTIVTERRVRGTLEKVYALTQGAHMSSEEISALSRADLLRYFTTFVASLLDDFARYLNNTEQVNLRADGVSFTKFPLEVSDEEFAALGKAVDAAILPYLNNKPAPERKRRIGAIITMPDRTAAQPSRGESAPETRRTPSDMTKEEK